MTTHASLERCRVCACDQLTVVVDLGKQALASRFPATHEPDPPVVPVVLVMCEQCKLVQLKHAIFQPEMYEHAYGYRSGISNTMRTHLAEYNAEIQTVITLNAGDAVLDIGSNDTTFLRCYPASTVRYGCDPTGTQFRSCYGSDIHLVPTYFTLGNMQALFPDAVNKFKVVSSISMFYDLPDPVQFAKDVCTVLTHDGLWTFEQSYALSMLEKNSVDTICHEHLEYYSIQNVLDILAQAHMRVVKLSLNDCNGGSFRVYAVKMQHALPSLNLSTLLQAEECLRDKDTYIAWMARCTAQVSRLKTFLAAVKAAQKSVYIYGASTKGNTLLQFAQLDASLLTFAVERNPEKVGKHTPGTRIPIISEDTMRAAPPDYLLVLPWHFKAEIIEREKTFLDQGGTLIFPLPTFSLVSRNKRALVTGASGQIAQYAVPALIAKGWNVYGLSSSPSSCPGGVVTYLGDAADASFTTAVMQSLQPHAVVHLASISSSAEGVEHPARTIQVNGVAACNLLDAIRSIGNACAFVHASSAELYRGHGKYHVRDDDLAFAPTHPYGFAKLMAHQMVQFYRSRYAMPASNLVLFTTESPRRKSTFFVKKLAMHAKAWASGCKAPLMVGSLDAHRSLCHASDVASAITLVLEQQQGHDYVVCGTPDAVPLRHILREVYAAAGLAVELRLPGEYTIAGELAIVSNEGACRGTGLDTMLTGSSERLRGIGWRPHYDSVQSIVADLVQ